MNKINETDYSHAEHTNNDRVQNGNDALYTVILETVSNSCD